MEKAWYILRVDGKIAATSTELGDIGMVLTKVALTEKEVDRAECCRISTEELFALSESLSWDDLLPIGTAFQKMVWKGLFALTHGSGRDYAPVSYTDFAKGLGKASAVRPVAHAIGKNPIPLIIPCHLIIPKESCERISELQAENALFPWRALHIIDKYVDYGEFALGRELKRELIHRQLARRV